VHHSSGLLSKRGSSASLSARELRFACVARSVELSFEESNDAAQANAFGNVSRSGLQLLLTRPVVVATRIKVEWPGMIVEGETRYCRPNGLGSFEVGMKIAALNDSKAFGLQLHRVEGFKFSKDHRTAQSKTGENCSAT
jgi:hypothetical protein